MILYVDGDSYTTPNYCVDQQDSYWALFGQYINAEQTINYAYPGKSNEGMIRNATRFVIENTNKEVFLLIGFSHLTRFDVCSTAASTFVNPNPSEQGVISKRLYETKDTSFYYNHEFEESKFLAAAITFYYFLLNRGIRFILHNCSRPLLGSNVPMLQSLCHEASSLDQIPNLFSNTYLSLNEEYKIKPADYAQYGYLGHHGAEGNAVYSKFLINHYQDIYEK